MSLYARSRNAYADRAPTFAESLERDTHTDDPPISPALRWVLIVAGVVLTVVVIVLKVELW